ncbi:MAG: hypothetical protein FD174_2939 [Geobacteraceae bacterium]|nr:MAG: hypothetical protein FD174_2939 [Geobacteraceae bacterium]
MLQYDAEEKLETMRGDYNLSAILSYYRDHNLILNCSV